LFTITSFKKFFVGVCITILFSGFSTAQATPISLVNADFETSWTGGSTVGGGYAYNPTSDQNLGWTFLGGSGVSQSNTAWNGVAESGNQFAFLQGTNTSISQSFNLVSASDVTVNFFMALRPGYSIGQGVAVGVDGNSMESFAATNTSWTQQTVDLGQFSAGSHLLSFSSTYAGGADTTAFIDNVKLTSAVPEAGEWAMMLLGLPLLGWVVRRKQA
jgi:hypothetical protein